MINFLHRFSWIPLLLVMALLVAMPCRTQAASGVGITNEDIASLSQDDSATSKTLTREAGPSLGAVTVRLLVSLGIVFGLMTGALWAAKRWLPRSLRNTLQGGGIDILATRPLGQRRSLLIVRARDKTLLLGITPQAIQTLAELDQDVAWSEAADEVGLPTNAFDARPGRPGQE